MKYTLHCHESSYRDKPVTWEVSNEEYTVATNLTEAEANIFLFALKAITNGHQLQYVTEEPDKEGNNVFIYEGPKEGIAP